MSLLEDKPVSIQGSRNITPSTACGRSPASWGMARRVVLVRRRGGSSEYWIDRPRRARRKRNSASGLSNMPGSAGAKIPRWTPKLALLADHLLAWASRRRAPPVPLVGTIARVRDRGPRGVGRGGSIPPAGPGRARRPSGAALAGGRIAESGLGRAAGDARPLPEDPPGILPLRPLRHLQSLRAAAPAPDCHILGRTRQPALVLSGERDHGRFAKRVREVAGCSPGAVTATLPGAHGAHFSHAPDSPAVAASCAGN